MRASRATWIVAVLMCGWIGAAPAVDIEIGPVGNDDPFFPWCFKDRHKVTPGQALDLTFRGRATGAASVTGRIHLAPGSTNHFAWPAGQPDPSPILTFTPTMAVLTGSLPRPLLVKPAAPLGPRYVKFIGVDSSGAETVGRQGCLVEVVSHLPDVQVTGLQRITPTGPLVTRVTVRMTIRNNSMAPRFLSVPWSISLSGTDLPGGQGPETVLASGVRNSVSAGATFTVTASYRSSQILGRERVIGRADPDNFLGENDAERANNSMMILTGWP